MKDGYKKFVDWVEYYLPMSFGSFLTFIVIIYLFYVVGRSILVNYNSNKDLDAQAVQINNLEANITKMQNEINYYQTNSYKEKQAREKLAYKAPGENVINLPIDKDNEKVADPELGEVQLKTPNYTYWIKYFSE